MGCATRIAQFESLGFVAHILQLVINDAIFSDLHIECYKNVQENSLAILEEVNKLPEI